MDPLEDLAKIGYKLKYELNLKVKILKSSSMFWANLLEPCIQM
jgi:hypothetical protein